MASSADLVRDSHLVRLSALAHALGYGATHFVIYMQILKEALLFPRGHLYQMRQT